MKFFMNKEKNSKIKTIKNALVFAIAFLLLGFSSFGAFAAEGDAVVDYKIPCIILIAVDILLFFIMYFTIVYYKKLRHKINVEKNLACVTLGTFLAFSQNLLIILIVICAILFLTICEFAYLISQSKKELQGIKDEALRKSQEIEEMLAKGNISYVMTEEAWYDIEKEKCDHYVRLGDTPLTYLNKEIDKELKSHVKDDARMGALKKLWEEYKNFE